MPRQSKNSLTTINPTQEALQHTPFRRPGTAFGIGSRVRGFNVHPEAIAQAIQSRVMPPIPKLTVPNPNGKPPTNSSGSSARMTWLLGRDAVEWAGQNQPKHPDRQLAIAQSGDWVRTMLSSVSPIKCRCAR